MTGNTNGKPAPQERFGHRPFYTRREASLCLAFPIGEGGPRQRRSGAFVSSDLCKNVFPSASPAFHSASALSAPSGHLPLEGKADDTRKACYQETFWHRHYLYSAALLLFMRRTTIPNSSFLIPHSRKAFIHNQWTEPSKGLTLNPLNLIPPFSTSSLFSS